MITDKLVIKAVDEIKDAPDYNKFKVKPKVVKITQAIIVSKGMQSGAPSVDLQMEDEKGNTYLVMATGGIIEMLGSAVAGNRQRQEDMAKARNRKLDS